MGPRGPFDLNLNFKSKLNIQLEVGAKHPLLQILRFKFILNDVGAKHPQALFIKGLRPLTSAICTAKGPYYQGPWALDDRIIYCIRAAPQLFCAVNN